MLLTFARCQEILDTLPIGYYLGRDIPVTLDHTGTNSFYDTFNNSITLSYPLIARALEQAKVPDEEQAVRSMLYHELSHVILTPRCAKSNTILNIFEDERIETLLNDYYMNVNFKKQLLDIHDNTIPPATDSVSQFFNAVRFRQTTPDINDKINRLISNYDQLTDTYGWSQYSERVYKLFQEITGHMPTEEEKQQQQGQGNSEDNNSEQQMNGQSEQEQEQPGEEQSSEEQKKQSLSQEEINKILENATMKDPYHGYLKNVAKSNIQKNAVEYKPSEEAQQFYEKAKIIIDNFNRKNQHGSGINSYSGVFNPRLVVNKDYRFFNKALSNNGNNNFGTCHLNLFIDASGSFSYSQKAMNGIIYALTEIEKRNKNFSMDISFINTDYYDCSSSDRYFVAEGGNDIPDDMRERFIKRQKPNSVNYNIVCFDGDAFSDDYTRSNKRQREIFSAFDFKQTTLITDRDNKVYGCEDFKQSRVIITDHYTEELMDNILKALHIAFS